MLSKFKQLKEDMEKNEWTITSFLFTYKSIKYVVLVGRFIDNVKKRDSSILVLFASALSVQLKSLALKKSNFTSA